MPIADQLIALQRIAQFSAKVRGHELGPWRATEVSAQSNCTHCGEPLRVYVSLIQPEMDGAALEGECPAGTVRRAA